MDGWVAGAEGVPAGSISGKRTSGKTGASLIGTTLLLRGWASCWAERIWS